MLRFLTIGKTIALDLQSWHNILGLYNVLIQVCFDTNKTKLDIQHNKVGIRIASRLKNLGLRELTNNGKFLNLGGDMSNAQPVFQKLNLENKIKKHAKLDIKRFQSCPILLDFFTLFQIFCPRLKTSNFSLKSNSFADVAQGIANILGKT